MLKTASEVSNSTNIRKSENAGNGGINDGNEVNSRELRGDFSKVNHFETRFSIFEARVALTRLRKTFIKVPILHHFDLECHILIETDVSSFLLVKFSSS